MFDENNWQSTGELPEHFMNIRNFETASTYQQHHQREYETYMASNQFNEDLIDNTHCNNQITCNFSESVDAYNTSHLLNNFQMNCEVGVSGSGGGGGGDYTQMIAFNQTNALTQQPQSSSSVNPQYLNENYIQNHLHRHCKSQDANTGEAYFPANRGIKYKKGRHHKD